MTSAGPCGMSTIIAQLACVVREMSLNGLIGQSHMVQVQYTLSRPVRNGYNHPFSRRWLARVDWAIVKSGGPCGTGSSTEGADCPCSSCYCSCTSCAPFAPRLLLSLTDFHHKTHHYLTTLIIGRVTHQLTPLSCASAVVYISDYFISILTANVSPHKCIRHIFIMFEYADQFADSVNS
jgi:hypothetical protein